MVPITKVEANFVRKNGWSKLADIFVDHHGRCRYFDQDTIVEESC